MASRSSQRTWIAPLASILLASLVGAPVIADSARSHGGRVGYRSHGHYARPSVQPPPAPAGAQHRHLHHGIFGGHQGAHRQLGQGFRIQPPYFSTTRPQVADPNYPGSVPPRPTTTVPITSFVYLGDPYARRVVYVPVAPEPAREPPPAPAAAAPTPIYVVVQSPGEGTGGTAFPSAPPPSPPAYPVPAERPARPKEPGQLVLSVHPASAEVYLDERFLGTGADLGRDVSREVKAGVHVLEVRHPEHRTERLFFGVPSAGGATVEVDLAAQSRRRSRLETTD